MKTILSAIKAELQDSLTKFKNSNIFITPDELLFPNEKSFPAIALKDSDITHAQFNQSILSEFKIKVCIYNEILKEDESSIMGDISTGKQGLLDYANSIRTTLDDNLLNIRGLKSAFCSSESESVLIAGRSRSAMRKILTYNYTKRT